MPGTGQGGPNAKIEDITITNNWWKNVSGVYTSTPCDGTVTMPAQIATPAYTCGNTQRWTVINNLATICDPNSIAAQCGTLSNNTLTNTWTFLGGIGQQNHVYEHNTDVFVYPPTAHTYSMAWNSNAKLVGGPAFTNSFTHSIWIRNNVMPRQISAPNGGAGFLGQTNASGQSSITAQVGDPPDNIPTRIKGNLFSQVYDANYQSAVQGNTAGCGLPPA